MRIMLSIATVALLAMPATGVAQTRPTIDDACLRVAELESRKDGLVIVSSQSFPELSPPRTEIEVGRFVGEQKEGMAGLIQSLDLAMEGHAVQDGVQRLGRMRCEFERTESPMSLSDFRCSMYPACTTFFETSHQRARLEELQVLLAREGY